jgi:threonine dehydratase
MPINLTLLDALISIDRIREASEVIDPVFLDTPQFVCEPISRSLGLSCILKVESVNPIRSFKGRGADYLLDRLGPQSAGFVCASAGNFGQGMAYAARRRGASITVYAATAANPMKVERMRALGATVVLEGADFEAAKDAAVRHSEKTGALYVEDGLLAPVGEGAGTIGVELTRMGAKLDAVFVPLGNGSLINGVGTWLRRASPATRIVAICPTGAPSMEISWRSGRATATDGIDTIADGIAVRVPIQEALDIMRDTVDEVMLVDDKQIVQAMQRLHTDAGLVVEPAGAAGLAALAARHQEFAGQSVAIVITGGNITDEQARRWLLQL